MPHTKLQNAPIAAFVYQFLYDVYYMIGQERHSPWFTDEKNAPSGVFSHCYTSKWEWSSSILLEAGAIKPLKPPPHLSGQSNDVQPWNGKTSFFTPVITLAECRMADYSRYETFDNYCYAMFTLFQFEWKGLIQSPSPHFLDDMAKKDDIFKISSNSEPIFDRERFFDKVITHWETMDVRQFKPIS